MNLTWLNFSLGMYFSLVLCLLISGCDIEGNSYQEVSSKENTFGSAIRMIAPNQLYFKNLRQSAYNLQSFPKKGREVFSLKNFKEKDALLVPKIIMLKRRGEALLLLEKTTNFPSYINGQLLAFTSSDTLRRKLEFSPFLKQLELFEWMIDRLDEGRTLGFFIEETDSLLVNVLGSGSAQLRAAKTIGRDYRRLITKK